MIFRNCSRIYMNFEHLEAIYGAKSVAEIPGAEERSGESQLLQNAKSISKSLKRLEINDVN